MHFEKIRNEVIQIIQSVQGRFLSSYQICQKLQVSYPQLWQSLVEEYPSTDPATPMGEGTGQQYSPASFVANALKHFNTNQTIPGLRQELFECEGVSFSGIAPGFTGNTVGIWAINA
jgi:hypothetical protein